MSSTAAQALVADQSNGDTSRSQGQNKRVRKSDTKAASSKRVQKASTKAASSIPVQKSSTKAASSLRVQKSSIKSASTTRVQKASTKAASSIPVQKASTKAASSKRVQKSSIKAASTTRVQKASTKAASSTQVQKLSTKAASPQLAQGWTMDKPDKMTPWMERSVQRWKLQAPYELGLADTLWEQYYKERAALEWLTNSFMAGWETCYKDPHGSQYPEIKKYPEGPAISECRAKAKSSTKKAARWREDWAPPQFKPFCSEGWDQDSATPQFEHFGDATQTTRKRIAKVLRGCVSQQDLGISEELPDLMASGSYILRWQGQFEEEFEPRVLEVTTRVYSPCGTPSSLDARYFFNNRVGWSYVDYSCCADLELGGPGGQPDEPQHSRAENGSMSLFSIDQKESGYQKRSLLAASDAREIEVGLFGRENVLSERKLLSLLVEACCIYGLVTGNTPDFLPRIIRRKYKLYVGEESDHHSEDDFDSENEAMKTSSRKRR